MNRQSSIIWVLWVIKIGKFSYMFESRNATMRTTCLAGPTENSADTRRQRRRPFPQKRRNASAGSKIRVSRREKYVCGEENGFFKEFKENLVFAS